MTTSPAGWYPDPASKHELRYWNGATWTEHVWSAGQQNIDYLPPTVPGAASAWPGTAETRRLTRSQGRDEFESTALAAARGDQYALAALPTALGRAAKLYRGRSLEEKKWQVLALAIRDGLEEDRLSEQEQHHLDRLAAALGLDIQQLAHRDLAAYEELVIASLNDGRLPVADVPIVLKPGEAGRASFVAELVKDVAVREMRGESSGVGIRVARGMTYRTGQMRARSVIVGTQLRTQDVGVLSVTNLRVVFVGQTRTLEFRLDKMVAIEQFQNGLRLSVSNRQLSSLFRIPPPFSSLIAAAVITRSM